MAFATSAVTISVREFKDQISGNRLLISGTYNRVDPALFEGFLEKKSGT
jgi:hypothetical protein